MSAASTITRVICVIYQRTARYPVTEIILHCAEIRPDWMAGHPLADKVAEIRRWHVQERGWRDIGYQVKSQTRFPWLAYFVSVGTPGASRKSF